MAPSQDDPFALQVTSNLMIKLTKVRKSEPTPKCQKPNPKQTQQSPMISHPKNKSQMEQNDKQIETPKTNGKIMSHDSHKRPPQTQYESASNVCAQPHQTEHLRHVHSSPTTQELKKKMKTQTQHRPHSTKGHQVKESIGGKKIESSNTIENHGLNTTQHSEWEKQENIYESPKEDPTMDHTFEKPNTSKLDHKMKGQGGLKDLVESKDMKNKSHPTNIMSQSVKNENPPQREVKLDGNTQQQSTHVGQSTNSYDRRKLDTSAFQDNELEEKTETQRKSKIEPRGSTSIQHSMASLELCEDLGRKKIGKNLKAHDNKAIESEQRLDNGENEMARQGILHAPEPCVCPSRPHLEAKTSAKNEAKKIIEQNSPNTSEEGELWRKFGHEDLGDINQKIPQAQPKELTRLETGNQFLQQIESHISKEKKLDKRTDIGASIIHRATLQATMMDPEESREEESKVLQCEAHILSPIAKPPTHQSPPRMADQCFTWPREESLLTPRAHDERVNFHQSEHHVPELKKFDIHDVQIAKTKKADDVEIHNLDSKCVDQRHQDEQSRVLQQQMFCLHEKDACIDCYKKNSQNPLECAATVRLYKECSQRIQKVAKGAYKGTTTSPSEAKNHVTK